MNLQLLAARREGRIGRIRREEAAATFKIRQITGEQLLPAAGGDALGEHGVEDHAAGRRERKAALLRAQAAQRLRAYRKIAALAPEALRTKVVGHAAARDRHQARRE